MHEGDPNEFAAKKNEPTVKRLNGLASQLIIAYVLMVVGTSMWAVFGLTCV